MSQDLGALPRVLWRTAMLIADKRGLLVLIVSYHIYAIFLVCLRLAVLAT